MVLKLILSVVAVAVLVTLGVRAVVYQPAQNVSGGQEKDSLVEVARRQKAIGHDKTTVSEMRLDYAGSSLDLDEALKIYSVVIAEPIESKSFALGKNDIQTWYRFRIIETLSRKSYLPCPNCSLVSVPQEMGKPADNEFFVNTIGGVLNVEGVEVTQPNNSLSFEKRKRHLMFVNLAPAQVGTLAGGPLGVFQLDQNDNLRSINKESAARLAELKQRFGPKLSDFKSHINR